MKLKLTSPQRKEEPEYLYVGKSRGAMGARMTSVWNQGAKEWMIWSVGSPRREVYCKASSSRFSELYSGEFVALFNLEMYRGFGDVQWVVKMDKTRNSRRKQRERTRRSARTREIAGGWLKKKGHILNSQDTGVRL